MIQNSADFIREGNNPQWSKSQLTSNNFCVINILAMLKQAENYIGPGGGTRRLHHKHMTKEELDTIRTAYIRLYGDRWRQQFAKYYWCVYDGAELGSTSSK